MKPVASLWFGSALLDGGWAADVRIGIEAGRIARIETGVRPGAEDERHAIALPGMPNLHSHAFQRAMAGLTERAGPGEDSFWTWRDLMYRFLERVGPEEVETITTFAFMEMLEAGFTHVGEFHYLHHDSKGRPYADVAELTHRIVASAQYTGLGLTLLPVLYAHANFGGVPPTEGQRRFTNDLDRFARVVEAGRAAVAKLEGGVMGVAPHSLRAVTPEELHGAVALAGSGPIHIHAAEQMREVNDCLAWSGRRPVEWLLEHAHLDGRWCLIHATHLASDETSRLAATGAVAGLCPITESNLGDGIFPALEFLGCKGAFGIGSDSNVLIDVAEELRLLEYSQRLLHRRRNVLAGTSVPSTGRRLYVDALAGGSQALRGANAKCGLVAGAPADIVSLDADSPSLISRKEDAVLDGWIFASRHPLVDCVWRHGSKVVADGLHAHHDLITARYRETLGRLLA
jgi:formimidoylglutamate deiminase